MQLSFESSDLVKTSKAASLHIRTWEQVLSLRITLQRIIDVSNRLPSPEIMSQMIENQDEIKSSSSKLSTTLAEITNDMIQLLEVSNSRDVDRSKQSRKRKLDENSTWERLCEVKNKLESNWKPVIDLHYARVHFGSDGGHLKLKFFKHSIWDQVDSLLEDPQRILQKSRMPSAQITGRIGDNSKTGEKMERPEFDEETYYDRTFYATLLKNLVSTASDDRNALQNQDEFQAALRSQKLSNKSKSSQVDRRASKGRKIRYVVHKKLENFMFPVPPTSSDIDAKRLFSSLFQ